MSRRKSVGQTLLIWAFLTVFIVLAFLGIVASINYSNISDLSDETCGSVGGKWVKTTYQFICVVDKGEFE